MQKDRTILVNRGESLDENTKVEKGEFFFKNI